VGTEAEADAMISQQIDYDAKALYIELADREVSRTEQIDPGTMVDLDENGQVIGIEVIHPDRPWPLDEILERFDIAPGDARELRAYFPTAPRTSGPAAHHADLKVAVNC
jgi:uncharacterized protein YuzE